jgi:hypothetical protein
MRTHEGGTFMRAFTLMPLLSVILLLGGQIPFPSYYAYASDCCGCTCKPWMCTCQGVGHCPRLQCHGDDYSGLQAQTLTNNQELTISTSYASSPTPTFRAYRIDRLISIASLGQCARSKFPLTLSQYVQDRLRFEPDFLNYDTNEQDNVLVVVSEIKGSD